MCDHVPSVVRMRRLRASVSISLAVVATAVVVASALATTHPRLTHCVAATNTQSGAGLALFTGTCNGKKTKLKIFPFKVTGRVGGVPVKFKREGSRFSGTIGKAYGTFVFHNRGITGTFERHRVRFTA